MSAIVPPARHRSIRAEPVMNTLEFLLREDRIHRQMLAQSQQDASGSIAMQRRRAQEVCFILAAGAQMEDEPYYHALGDGRTTPA